MPVCRLIFVSLIVPIFDRDSCNFSIILKKNEWLFTESRTHDRRVKCPGQALYKTWHFYHSENIFMISLSPIFDITYTFWFSLKYFCIKSIQVKPLNSWKICEQFNIWNIFDSIKERISVHLFLFHVEATTCSRNYLKSVRKCVFSSKDKKKKTVNAI